MREKRTHKRELKKSKPSHAYFRHVFPGTNVPLYVIMSSGTQLSMLPLLIGASRGGKVFCLLFKTAVPPALVGLINIVIQSRASISRCSAFVIERSFEGGGRKEGECRRKEKASCCLMSGLLIQKGLVMIAFTRADRTSCIPYFWEERGKEIKMIL